MVHKLKVLVICWHALGKESGTGIVFSNLLADFLPHNVAQIYGQAVDPDPNKLLCSNSYHLSWRQVYFERLVRRSCVFLTKRAQTSSATTVLPSGTVRKGNFLKGAARAWADMVPFELDSAFWAWVKQIAPDVIFTNLGDLRWMNCALSVSRRIHIPLVPFFNDDWPSTRYAGQAFTLLPRLLLLRKLKQVLALAPIGIGASDEMAREYTKRYEKRFEAMLPAADSQSTPPFLAEKTPGEPVELVYVGGLHLKRFERLRRIGDAVAELREEGLNCTLKIYCPDADALAWGKEAVVPGGSVLGGSLRYHEIEKVLNRADILVFVESTDEEFRRYTRLSFSTKIAQYMAAGRPILAYGPEEVASCKYISESGAGLVLGNESSPVLKEALRRLIVEPELRRELGLRSWRAARERHDSSKQRKRFRELLTEAVRLQCCRRNK